MQNNIKKIIQKNNEITEYKVTCIFAHAPSVTFFQSEGGGDTLLNLLQKNEKAYK